MADERLVSMFALLTESWSLKKIKKLTNLIYLTYSWNAVFKFIAVKDWLNNIRTIRSRTRYAHAWVRKLFLSLISRRKVQLIQIRSPRSTKSIVEARRTMTRLSRYIYRIWRHFNVSKLPFYDVRRRTIRLRSLTE